MTIPPEGQATFLDEIFCEAFDNADHIEERLELIEKFESGYPHSLKASTW